MCGLARLFGKSYILTILHFGIIIKYNNKFKEKRNANYQE